MLLSLILDLKDGAFLVHARFEPTSSGLKVKKYLSWWRMCHRNDFKQFRNLQIFSNRKIRAILGAFIVVKESESEFFRSVVWFVIASRIAFCTCYWGIPRVSFIILKIIK